MRRSNPAAPGLIALGLALAAATPAAAQIDFSRELDQIDQAVMGLASASTHFQADLKEVARLHGHVVALRQPSDPSRYDCLMRQASLLSATGDAKGARKMVAQAVGQAQGRGETLNAAEASIVAAVLAQQAGDYQAEKKFRVNARNLALTPGVTLAQANAIAARLYGAAWKAAPGKGPSAFADD